jgi:hypothetical protein
VTGGFGTAALSAGISIVRYGAGMASSAAAALSPLGVVGTIGGAVAGGVVGAAVGMAASVPDVYRRVTNGLRSAGRVYSKHQME